MQNQKSKLVDTLLTPALAGIAAGAGFYFILGEKDRLPFLNFEEGLPGYLAVGGTVFASSLVANATGSYILPMIPKNYRYADMEKRIIAPVVTGLAAYGLLYLSDPLISQTPGAMLKLVGLGAGSELVAQYAADTVKPMLV